MSDNSAAVNLSDVVFSYPGGPAVINGCSASLAHGRITVLLGPNAAGKTTLFKLILGVLRPQSGWVRVNGRPVDQMTRSELAGHIALVPQQSTTPLAFTARQVVALGRHALVRDEAAVDRAIESCDLRAHQHKPYPTLSAGQQQRVLLARALAQVGGIRGLGQTKGGSRPLRPSATHGPEADPPDRAYSAPVLVLDEPTSAMDLRHVLETFAVLRALADRGPAVLMSLHDLNLAARFADEVWLMDQGRLVAAGPWESVMKAEVLEPVYGVRLAPSGQAVRTEGGVVRPAFAPELPGG